MSFDMNELTTIKRAGGLRWLTGGALLSMALTAQAGGVVVVVSAKSPAGALTKEQVSDIFMGRSSSLPDGGSIEPVDQPESNDVRDEFYTKVTGKSASQLKAYWAKMSFTGKGNPPRELNGNAEVKRAVAGNPGLVGYIEKSAADDSVKVLFSAQ